MQNASLLFLAAWSSMACATYQEAPLNKESEVLSRVPDALSVDASELQRPFLAGKQIDLSGPLDRDALGLIALLYNPDLIALRSRAHISDAQLLDARLIPDPAVGISADRVISGPVSAAPGGFGFQLTQDINSLRTRDVRIEVARNSARQVRLDLAWAEWQTVEQARILAARVYYLLQARDLAEASQDSTEELLKRSVLAAGRGDILPEQLQATRIAALDAADRATQVKLALAGAQRELRRLLGVPPDWSVKLGPPPVPENVPRTEELVVLAQGARLDLEALRAGYAAEEARVRKSILDQFPTFDLNVGGSRDNSQNGFIGMGVNLTLPAWNRNRGGIAIEEATRAALRAEYDARIFAVRADIARLLAELETLGVQAQRLQLQITPLAQFAERARKAADRGDLSDATAITAEQAVRDMRSILLGVSQQTAELWIGLELSTGAPWSQWNKQ